MILALDVHYREDFAKAVGVLFDWQDSVPKQVFTEIIQEFEEYIPGSFYKRELPCLLKILENINIKNLEAIIVDGNIYKNNEKQAGLGYKLYEALHKEIPVIGVAKTHFVGIEKTFVEVFRGNSKQPLYISSVGIDVEASAQAIKSMAGKFRFPDILKTLDTLTKK